MLSVYRTEELRGAASSSLVFKVAGRPIQLESEGYKTTLWNDRKRQQLVAVPEPSLLLQASVMFQCSVPEITDERHPCSWLCVAHPRLIHLSNSLISIDLFQKESQGKCSNLQLFSSSDGEHTHSNTTKQYLQGDVPGVLLKDPG